MNKPNQTNSAPGQSPNDSPAKAIRTRNPIIKTVAGLLVATVLAVASYSIYVAVHEPDPQETIILGQTKIASGSSAAFRILVRDRVSEKPVAGAAVELSLLGKTTGMVKLGVFHTDASGSIPDSIGIPDVAPGDYQLVVDSASPLGRDHIVKKVEIEHPARVLLSSDKPIYQPGQTIHLRSLTINERTQKPFANEPVTFEVNDPKGNKVFKETRTASAHGIASTDFVLADELNLGRYEIRAIAGPTTAERTVEIKRYVLPKFKIQITTDKPYYLPGQTVSGSVQAAYFFGKPVGNGDVKLTVATFQEKPVVITELQGRTDAAGNYSFQFVLPDFFAGMPQKNEQAFLDLTADVSDTAQHNEERTLSLSVAQNELEITAIPEAGGLVPGVENILYVLTSYPDGRPAACRIVVDGKAYQGDAQGVCDVKIVPNSADQQFEIQASDQAGRNRKITFRPENHGEVPALLLRTDKAIYQAGETAHISLLSPEMNNTVFIDVIKDGQTVLTKSVSLDDHKAGYALGLPASLVGVLKLNAYIITEAGEDRGCSRIVYVNPASGLRIAAKLSQPVYRPGETAKLDFTVTDAAGLPAPAALGIDAVDESVFALAENRPGLGSTRLKA
jgi:5-hydroxyisourate hydrolase-like protein (transthyretin family)